LKEVFTMKKFFEMLEEILEEIYDLDRNAV
jgi:hypothetical protein